MRITTITSRMFNQDVSKAKRASAQGPVFITDRGRPAHVLLSISDYQRISAQQESIVNQLTMPDAEEVDFEPAKINTSFYRPADFS